MLDFFYKISFYEGKRGKIYTFINKVIELFAGYLVEFLYFISLKKNGINDNEGEDKIIISITTYPARINKIWITLESLLNQKYKPNKIILWLSEEQFPNKEIPSRIKKMQRRGIQINWCQDDLKSYKKFIYAGKKYNDSIIITADDDVIYPRYWIKQLIETYKKNKDCVCCYRAHEIKFNTNGNIKRYEEFKLLSIDKIGPSHLLLATGVGGILYPPFFFNDEMLNFQLIKKLCPFSDDIWLKFMELKYGYKVVKVGYTCPKWFSISKTQDEALYLKNREENQNDIAIEKLIKYFDIDFRRCINEEEC